MKISDIVYKDLKEVRAMPSFDMKKPPVKPKWFLVPIAWLLSFPETIKHRVKIIRQGTENLKGGYVLLCNHNSFFDFKVATRALFPRLANNIVAIDGFINREQLLRDVGCILRRKFITDMMTVNHIKHILKKLNNVCAIYPEARYSLVGTNAILPPSLGKLVKLLQYPVATLICHGHHLQQPVWNLNKRKLKTSADFKLLFTKEQLKTLSVDEINKKINEAFIYDDYQYQLENNIHITYKHRAKNLHKVLYQCPSCKSEQHMNSDFDKLWCDKCKKNYQMDTLGQLKALNGETEFTHIPDWFEWQRQQVNQQIKDATYCFNEEVAIDILQNSTGYYRIGKGKLIHDKSGFRLFCQSGDQTLNVEKRVLDNYSVHIEFDYFKKGDAISFSTDDETYYIYPINPKVSVTKIHFAVEEMYKLHK
jgi:transposase-like protein